MKKAKKVLTNIFALTLVTNAGAIFSACEGSPVAEQRKLFDPNGVWQCQYVLYSKTECELGDWTQEYKKEHEYPDYIFFPSYIGDVKVVQLGYSMGMGTRKYKGKGKRFVPHTVRSIRQGGAGIFMLPIEGVVIQDFYAVFTAEEYCQSYIEAGMDLYKANVEYHYNYENSQYKYYCVDNYDYTTEEMPSHITIIPPEPEREGYTFGGWYKEAECINEWDFEKDALPLILIEKDYITGDPSLVGGVIYRDEDGRFYKERTVFQKVSLYARWC